MCPIVGYGRVCMAGSQLGRFFAAVAAAVPVVVVVIVLCYYLF